MQVKRPQMHAQRISTAAAAGETTKGKHDCGRAGTARRRLCACYVQRRCANCPCTPGAQSARSAGRAPLRLVTAMQALVSSGMQRPQLGPVEVPQGVHMQERHGAVSRAPAALPDCGTPTLRTSGCDAATAEASSNAPYCGSLPTDTHAARSLRARSSASGPRARTPPACALAAAAARRAARCRPRYLRCRCV
jgi:hypothetical protein